MLFECRCLGSEWKAAKRPVDCETRQLALPIRNDSKEIPVDCKHLHMQYPSRPHNYPGYYTACVTTYCLDRYIRTYLLGSYCIGCIR